MPETEVLEGSAKTDSQAKKNKTVAQPTISQLLTQKFQVPKRDNRVFYLTDKKTKGTVTIIAVEDVYDPEKKVVRRARLLRGADSIWMDEQKHFDQMKGYVGSNTLSLVIDNGRMVIDMKDSFRNKFVDLSNKNIENPHRFGSPRLTFQEWNTDKQADALLRAEEREFEALEKAAAMSIDDIIPHAQYLGVDFIDNVSGHHLNEKGIRTAYMRKAKTNPQKFLDSLNTPIVELSHKIRTAIDDGKIDLGREAGQAFYKDGGFIAIIPQGRNAIEYLIEYAQIQGEANQQFVFQLDNLV